MSDTIYGISKAWVIILPDDPKSDETPYRFHMELFNDEGEALWELMEWDEKDREGAEVVQVEVHVITRKQST